jgi:NAD(P)-dependent dehydrogenase (short-subunit alcohol dehydrogenase family)
VTALTALTALVTGGTDGIGAATALELRRRGVHVTIVGRSADKAQRIVDAAAAIEGPGSLVAITTDLSLMANVRSVAQDVAARIGHLDLLLGAAGILISRTEHTTEGIEKDFAVGYLSRFVMLETLSQLGAIDSRTRVITIAASSPVVPKYARLEFDDLSVVRARTGMTSHGQAQLANDLLTAQAASRYGVTAIGYGPGSVDTNIRREIPAVVRAIMKPFFARSTRSAAEVGAQLADIFADATLEPAGTSFFDRTGSFPMAEYIADPVRQRQLLDVSLALADIADGSSRTR